MIRGETNDHWTTLAENLNRILRLNQRTDDPYRVDHRIEKCFFLILQRTMWQSPKDLKGLSIHFHRFVLVIQWNFLNGTTSQRNVQGRRSPNTEDVERFDHRFSREFSKSIRIDHRDVEEEFEDIPSDTHRCWTLCPIVEHKRWSQVSNVHLDEHRVRLLSTFDEETRDISMKSVNNWEWSWREDNACPRSNRKSMNPKTNELIDR